ncbi:ribosome small subunit-dependent GTPase A [Ruminococcaceae bacterium OttesenSCG-928-I18]|nr:ribosome small subunit-dependent GTPase A [Ruminococcaceae bacterium OttesenSCG-928-I18]
MTGRIYKGIGGFYYVKTEGGEVVEVKPRGIFRKRGQKPLAGDEVVLEEEADTLFIAEILPRKNAFVRPPVANVDTVFIVVSTVDPSPSTLVIDKLSAVAVDEGAQPVLLLTKTDLAEGAEVLDIYAKAGFPAFETSVATGEGLTRLKEMLKGKLSVFSGNSGVGKSTLLNVLHPDAQRETAQISKKLGRGRHTTREVEIFEVEGGLVADTPGFASFDLQRAATISAENLQFAFPEIAQRMPACKFSGCTHMAETGCAIRKAVQSGEISPSRYRSYQILYEEAKESERF